TSTTCARATIRRAGSPTERARGVRRVPSGRARASGRVVQLRDVSDAKSPGGGRPRPGNLPPRFPVFPPFPAGNPPPRLAVSNLEEHVFDVLSASRAGIGARGGRCSGLGRSDVSRRARGGERRRRAAHRSGERFTALTRGISNGAAAG